MRIHTVPYMKPIHITQRINFAKELLNDRKWRRTFFLDEFSFQAYSHKKYCYQNPKERVSKPRPKHPPKVHLIAMISYKGPTRLIIFEHNLKASSLVGYLDLLVKDAKVLYPDDDFRICLDNDSKHTSKDMADFALENNLDIVRDWPSSSPDLNPIENVWGKMSIELQKLSPQNADDLRKALKTIWRRVVTREY